MVTELLGGRVEILSQVCKTSKTSFVCAQNTGEKQVICISVSPSPQQPETLKWDSLQGRMALIIMTYLWAVKPELKKPGPSFKSPLGLCVISVKFLYHSLSQCFYNKK